jgi:hypothetical protein
MATLLCTCIVDTLNDKQSDYNCCTYRTEYSIFRFETILDLDTECLLILKYHQQMQNF